MLKRFLLLLLVAVSCSAFADNRIEGVRVWPSPDKTRIVFDLSEAPEFSYFTLYQKHPYRVVIDFRNAQLKAKLQGIANDSLLVKKVRTSTPQYADSSRIVIELDQKSDPEIFALPANDTYGDRLVVDLPGKSIERSGPAKSVAQLKDRKITVAVDAGHGGDDPGSIGPRGTYEKGVVLPIAKALAALINSDPGMQAYLIRSGDYYVGLDERTEKAREANADIFVSVHADAFTSPEPSGASVWVLSKRRADSEIGRWLESREIHSELLGGASEILEDREAEPYLARALLDMSMDSSMAGGYAAANAVIGELREVTEMHKRRPQAASLAVLKSPDRPSILVETGFISNPREERLLSSNGHQQKLARAIYQGIRRYFIEHPIDGTYLAKQQDIPYKVKSGDSLSELAERYGTSVAAIKKRNNLKSSTLYIGQTLDIPSR
ncbi:N-acetylmuramoyl-L-alanine amidase [Idiomarina tyrosinivorans]|uniref:N-acetylmuramoyl-L-alanine amidase AmiC n=1 Tax=Idiomarina tyrosinivorans TaxID=1445662 RepID=A0A432ZQJ7_9GAMM|nr:N-acetylmuramoyl-L-alanine amidase [Idiomarina tyrosinivorans]RUO80184.1 N-acetylmuramoyl-L-alanine amidase [Idiomarina tyrosinivorans]